MEKFASSPLTDQKCNPNQMVVLLLRLDVVTKSLQEQAGHWVFVHFNLYGKGGSSKQPLIMAPKRTSCLTTQWGRVVGRSFYFPQNYRLELHYTTSIILPVYFTIVSFDIQ